MDKRFVIAAITLMAMTALVACTASGEGSAPTVAQPAATFTSEPKITPTDPGASASGSLSETPTQVPSPTPRAAISRENASDMVPVAVLDMGVEPPALAMTWSPDGRYLATSGFSVGRVWTVDSWQPRILSQWTAGAASWSGDGSMLAIADQAGSVAIWEERNWAILRNLGDSNNLALGGGLAWDPQDRFLIIPAGDGPRPYLTVWDPATWEFQRAIPMASLLSFAASPRGDLVAASTYDGQVRIWETSEWKELPAIEPGCWNVNGLAFSPDGKTLATGDDCGKIRFWGMPPATSNLMVGPLWLGSPQGFPVMSLAWSPDGTLLAAGLGNWQRNLVPVHPAIVIWDLVSGEVVISELGETAGDGSVAWSPDGTLLAVAGYTPKAVQILGIP